MAGLLSETLRAELRKPTPTGYLNKFSVDKYEVETKEVTSFGDAARRFAITGVHLVIKRGDGSERHLYGKQAKQFMKLLGAPECFRERKAA